MKKLFSRFQISDCMRQASMKRDFSFLIGRKIWIISCPRKFDGADAYANLEGIIKETLSDGGVCISLQGGGSLVIAKPHIKNLQFLIL